MDLCTLLMRSVGGKGTSPVPPVPPKFRPAAAAAAALFVADMVDLREFTFSARARAACFLARLTGAKSADAFDGCGAKNSVLALLLTSWSSALLLRQESAAPEVISEALECEDFSSMMLSLRQSGGCQMGSLEVGDRGD